MQLLVGDGGRPVKRRRVAVAAGRGLSAGQQLAVDRYRVVVQRRRGRRTVDSHCAKQKKKQKNYVCFTLCVNIRKQKYNDKKGHAANNNAVNCK